MLKVGINTSQNDGTESNNVDISKIQGLKTEC